MHSNLQATTAKLSNQLDLASERHRNRNYRRKRKSRYFYCHPLPAGWWCWQWLRFYLHPQSCHGAVSRLLRLLSHSRESFLSTALQAWWGNSSQQLPVPWWFSSTSLNSLRLALWLWQVSPAGTPGVRVMTTRDIPKVHSQSKVTGEGCSCSSSTQRAPPGKGNRAWNSVTCKPTLVVVWDEGQVKGKLGT